MNPRLTSYESPKASYCAATSPQKLNRRSFGCQIVILKMTKTDFVHCFIAIIFPQIYFLIVMIWQFIFSIFFSLLHLRFVQFNASVEFCDIWQPKKAIP